MLGHREKQLHFAALLLSATVTWACSKGQPPQTQLTAAESAVRAAEVGGGEELPKGKLHLKYARDQIQQANALIAEKKYEEAELLLKRAEIDAHYALALAQHAEAEAEAQEILKRIDELMEAGK